MEKTGETLIDAALIPDPDADVEMGPSSPSDVSDEEVEGSRLLVVKRAKTNRSLFSNGAVVELECSFQPADRMRFSSAVVQVDLKAPAGATFIDIAPQKVGEPLKVHLSYEASGKISIGLGKVGVEPSGKTGRDFEYETFQCLVQGTGSGTARARWTFKEDDNLRNGIGPSVTLAMTIEAKAVVRAEFYMRARLERGGLVGGARDLLFGRARAERFKEIVLYTP